MTYAVQHDVKFFKCLHKGQHIFEAYYCVSSYKRQNKMFVLIYDKEPSNLLEFGSCAFQDM